VTITLSSSESATQKRKRNSQSAAPAQPAPMSLSASEDALLQTRKHILAVDQEARNEIHRQEALFWKVKREIMVAEALAKGIKLPASITNLDAGAPSRLFNGNLDIILQNIQKTETIIFWLHTSVSEY
jgi:hypothetical protein